MRRTNQLRLGPKDVLSTSVSRREFVRRAALIGMSLPIVGGLLAACEDDDVDGVDDEDAAAEETEPDDDPETEPDDDPETEPDDDPETEPDEEEDVDAEAEDDETEDETVEGDPQYGGSLVVLEPNDFVNMWPAFTTGPTAEECYDNLVKYEHDGEEWTITPMLAESWEVDELALTFHLREDVEFHDGTPFNAEAAAWNIAQWRQHPLSRAVEQVAFVNEDNPAEAIDEYTVQINLAAPDGALLIALSDRDRETRFGSPTAWEEIEREEDEDAATVVVREAVGTGPFVFEEWVSGSHITVRRNENYWGTDEDGNQLPFVDEVRYRWVSEDSVRLVEMRAQEGHIAEFVQGRDVDAVENDPNLQYVQDEFAGGTIHRFFFNGLRGPFSDNPDLRKAIQYAIDREAMASTLGGGIGIPATLDVAQGTVGYDERVPYYWYDLERAWEHREASGVESGFTFRYVVHDREIDRQQVEMVQQFVREIDLDVQIDVVERAAWVHQVREDMDFEMASQRGEMSPDNAPSWALRWEPGEEPPAAYSRAEEPEIWDKIQEARSEMDPDDRHEAYVELQTMMHEAAWWGTFWILPANWMLHRSVQGFPLLWSPIQGKAKYVWLEDD
jgi:peptide/nickel transport system substrate-binding protein